MNDNANDMPAPLEEENEVGSFQDIKGDPTFLAAKGSFKGDTERDKKKEERSHIKRLASRIFYSMRDHGDATIRAVGPFASHNALKAIALAKGYCSPAGIELCWTVSVDEGNIGPLRREGHVNDVVAFVFSIKGFKEWLQDKGE